MFWGARLGLQLALFDPTPHLSNRWLKLGHHGLTLMFLYFTLVYGWVALEPPNLPTLGYGEAIVLLLQVAAVGQGAVGLLNLTLPFALRWRPALSQLPLLPRQVFYVHSLFISVTLGIFAVLTWRFADSMAAGEGLLATWLAGGIGVFWGLRALVQVVYYSPRHWFGKPRETAAHITLLLAYSGMSVVYFLAVRGS